MYVKEKEFEIHNVRVYGIKESILASGYAMNTDITPPDMDEVTLGDNDTKRSRRLGKTPTNSGEPCYLKGIIVQFDMKAPEYIWRQLDRYHFIDFVTSQSKMHNLVKFGDQLDDMCNKWVNTSTIGVLKFYIDMYNTYEKGKFEDGIQLRDGSIVPYTKSNLFKLIVSNCPSGFLLTARMTTNYLQLKNIRQQRAFHKMPEWHYFDEWLSTLPAFDEITDTKCKAPIGVNKNEKDDK